MQAEARRLAQVPPPPERPGADECCGNGCEPCIFEVYDEALARWEARWGVKADQPEQ